MVEGDAKFYIVTIAEKNFAFTLFASQFVIDFVKKNINRRNYLLDGTFDKIPTGYYQLLIISFEYNNESLLTM